MENPVLAENIMLVEHHPKEGMETSMHSCHTTLYAFGVLVVLLLFVQTILQYKALKVLRKPVKR